MKKTTLIITIMMIILTNTVIASTPKPYIDTTFEESYLISDDNLGEIIIRLDDYQESNITTNTFEVLTAEKYDEFYWNGNRTINLNKDNLSETLIPNTHFPLLTTGTYTYTALSDGNLTGEIIVGNPKNLNLKINIDTNVDESKINLEYDKQILISDGEEKVIPVKVNFSSYLLSSNYSYKIIITDDNINLTKELTGTFIIKPTYLIDVAKNDLPTTIETSVNSFTQLGIIELENKGNININVTTDVDGERPEYFNIKSSSLIPTNTKVFFPVMLQIPSNANDGIYNYSINFVGQNFTYQHKVILKIKDLILPEILNISFSDDRIYRNTTMTVITKDNFNVKKAIAIFNTTNTTVELVKDQQTFHKNFYLNETGEKTFHICIYDDADNEFCDNKTLNVKKLSIIDAKTSLTFPKTKIGKYSKIMLFNITEDLPEPINITFLSLKTDTVNDTINFEKYELNLVDEDNNKQLLIINTTTQLFKKGVIFLEIRSDVIRDNNAVLRVYYPLFTRDNEDVNVAFSFADYSVPDNFEDDSYGKKIICESHDEGNINDSEIICKISYPITTEIGSLSFPTTINEQNLQEEIFEKEKEVIEKKLNKYSLLFTSAIMVLLLVFGLLIYVIKFQPYFRFRVKESKGD